MSASASVPEFNKKTMVDYMMLSNKVFEHCTDDKMEKAGIEELFNEVKKITTRAGTTNKPINTMLTNLKELSKGLNTDSKNNVKKHIGEILFIIVQHCLGDKNGDLGKQSLEYNQYQKNVIHNIIFNILKKNIINDFETFILIGIIKKIINRGVVPNSSGGIKNIITLSHIDTLVYILDKLFLYKFPDDKSKNRRTNRGNPITKNGLDVPDIYNRYIVYLNLLNIKDDLRIQEFKFYQYFNLYNKVFIDNAGTFNNSIPKP